MLRGGSGSGPDGPGAIASVNKVRPLCADENKGQGNGPFSGFASREDIQKSRAAGFLDHFTKPINPARLEELSAKITT